MLKKLIGAAFVFAAVCAAPAHATTVNLNPNNSWYEFDVDELIEPTGGLEWIDLAGNALSFTFTTTTLSALTVVDGGFGGDQFEVFDNGISLGLTTTGAPTYPTSIGHDFDAALASGNYGYLTYVLAAGTHTITGVLTASAISEFGPINATVGALSVAPVPLPASVLLLLSGGGLMRLFSRRRNQVVA